MNDSLRNKYQPTRGVNILLNDYFNYFSFSHQKFIVSDWDIWWFLRKGGTRVKAIIFFIMTPLWLFDLNFFLFGKEMKILRAKQEEETKRLREQIEAEAAVQRKQMENMVKARMV